MLQNASAANSLEDVLVLFETVA